VLALAGIGIAGYLTVTRAMGEAPVCTTGGCEIVQRSRYAELLGIPVAWLGLGAYVVLLVTALSTRSLAVAAGAAVALGGLAFSLYLLVVQLAVIDAVCQWCVASDVVMAALAVLTVVRVLAFPGGPAPVRT
jgi:uncharacterized membrane protein